MTRIDLGNFLLLVIWVLLSSTEYRTLIVPLLARIQLRVMK